jgi:hypothetical protein
MANVLTKEETVERHEVTPEEQPVPMPEPAPQAAKVPLWRRLLPHAAVLVGLTLIAIGTTWPLFPNLGGYVIDKNNPLYSVWLMAWQVHAFTTAPLDIFDTNIIYPIGGTLAFDELAFTEAVLSAPFLWIFGNPVLSHNIVLFSTFILAGYGAWLLVRELTGNGWAGFVAACAYAFSFYMLNHLPHMTLINAQWIPFILLAAYKTLWTHQWRWALALGGFFALQALSGHYLAFYTAFLLALFFLYYLVVQRDLYSWPLIGKLAVAFTGAALIILPIGIPYGLIQSSYGFRRDLFEVERFSNTLTSFLAVFRGSPRLREVLSPFADPGPWAVERSAYPGLAAVLLGIVGTIAPWRRARRNDPSSPDSRLKRHAIFFAGLALLTALLSLGPYLQPTYAPDQYDPAAINRMLPLPYLFLHEWVPGFSTMRVVARIGVLTALALAVLAGFGAHYLMRWLGERLRGARLGRRAFAPLALPALAVMLALVPVGESWSAPVGMEPVGTRSAVPPVYRWLAEQPQTVILEYPMTHFRRGEISVVMQNEYQYYSVYHWHEMINGSAAIRPFAYSALVVETEKCFPCPASLDALWAMGVEYVVVHLDNLSGPQREDFLWRSTDPAGKVVGTFTLVQEFGSDRVYRVEGPREVAGLREALPRDASLLLGDVGADPERQPGDLVYGGYMAAMGWMLRDNEQWSTNTRVAYGQSVSQADPSTRTDYALLWSTQSAGPEWERVWANEFVTLYKRR